MLGKRTARTEKAFERDHEFLLGRRPLGRLHRLQGALRSLGAARRPRRRRAGRRRRPRRPRGAPVPIVRRDVVRQDHPRPDLRRDRPHHAGADRARALRGRLGRRQGTPRPRAHDPRPRAHAGPAPRRRPRRDGHPRSHRPRRRPPPRSALLGAGRLRDLRRPAARALQPHRPHPRHRCAAGSPRPTSSASCSTARPASSTSAPQRRFFRGALKHAIELRDRTCFHPSCDEPPLYPADRPHRGSLARAAPPPRPTAASACGFHNRWRNHHPDEEWDHGTPDLGDPTAGPDPPDDDD